MATNQYHKDGISLPDNEEQVTWGTRVPCEKCEEELHCYLFKLEKDKYALYNYLCKSCGAEGPWSALAIRKVGHKSYATGKSKRYKAK